MFGSAKGIGGNKAMPQFYRGGFKVSVPANLSRAVFSESVKRDAKLNIPTLGDSREYFSRDINKVMETSDPKELLWTAQQMVSHYTWPVMSIGLFIKEKDSDKLKQVEAAIEGVRSISAIDIGLDDPESIAMHVIASGRMTYIPDTKFDYFPQIVQMPKTVMAEIFANRTFEGETLDIKTLKWDTKEILKNINPHSNSMLMMPLELNGETIGLLAIGFLYIHHFGDMFPANELVRPLLIGDAVRLGVGNILFPPQKRT